MSHVCTLFADSLAYTTSQCFGSIFHFWSLEKEEYSWAENTAVCIEKKKKRNLYNSISKKMLSILMVSPYFGAAVRPAIRQERKTFLIQAGFFQSWRSWEDVGFFSKYIKSPNRCSHQLLPKAQHGYAATLCRYTRDYLIGDSYQGIYGEKLPKCWF